jgi:hypothetical protein
MLEVNNVENVIDFLNIYGKYKCVMYVMELECYIHKE